MYSYLAAPQGKSLCAVASLKIELQLKDDNLRSLLARVDVYCGARTGHLEPPIALGAAGKAGFLYAMTG